MSYSYTKIRTLRVKYIPFLAVAVLGTTACSESNVKPQPAAPVEISEPVIAEASTPIMNFLKFKSKIEASTLTRGNDNFVVISDTSSERSDKIVERVTYDGLSDVHLCVQYTGLHNEHFAAIRLENSSLENGEEKIQRVGHLLLRPNDAPLRTVVSSGISKDSLTVEKEHCVRLLKRDFTGDIIISVFPAYGATFPQSTSTAIGEITFSDFEIRPAN